MKKILLILCLFSVAIVSAQSVPYNVNKKKFPLVDEFQKLFPLTLGKWTRYAFHDYVPNQENGHVFYKNDNVQIYVVFGKAANQTKLNTAWLKLFDEATMGKEKLIKQKNTTSNTCKYVLMQDNKFYYFAWTRNLFYFSIQTKNKLDADEFMKLFPY